jgi:hypothetical protein
MSVSKTLFFYINTLLWVRGGWSQEEPIYMVDHRKKHARMHARTHAHTHTHTDFSCLLVFALNIETWPALHTTTSKLTHTTPAQYMYVDRLDPLYNAGETQRPPYSNISVHVWSLQRCINILILHEKIATLPPVTVTIHTWKHLDSLPFTLFSHVRNQTKQILSDKLKKQFDVQSCGVGFNYVLNYFGPRVEWWVVPPSKGLNF